MRDSCAPGGLELVNVPSPYRSMSVGTVSLGMMTRMISAASVDSGYDSLRAKGRETVQADMSGNARC